MPLAPLHRLLLSAAALAVATPARAQHINLAPAARSSDGWHTVGRAPATRDSAGMTLLRFPEGPGGAMVWTPLAHHADIAIEVDVRGRNIYQKSFVGLVFHVAADSVFDVVYVRPFNIRAEDSTHRAHALQYAADPSSSWEKLRADHPGANEAPVPARVDPDGWIHLRLVTHGRDLRVFVNRDPTPALDVQLLGTPDGGIGLWVGDHSDGEFTNLVVGPAASDR